MRELVEMEQQIGRIGVHALRAGPLRDQQISDRITDHESAARLQGELASCFKKEIRVRLRVRHVGSRDELERCPLSSAPIGETTGLAPAARDLSNRRGLRAHDVTDEIEIARGV